MITPKTYEEVEDELIKGGKGFASFKRMIGEMLSQRRESAKLGISIIVTAVMGTIYPLSIGLAIDAILIQKSAILLAAYASLFFAVYVVQFFSNRVRTISSTYLAQYTIKSLRDKAFKNLQKVPVSFYSKVKTGYLISRISNDGESLSEFLTFQVPQVVSGITTVIISASIMLILSPRLALYSFIVIPLLVGFTFSLQPRVKRNYLRTRKTIAAITGNLSENINAIRAIKSFNVEGRVEGNFDKLNTANYSANMKASRLASSYGSVVRIIEAVGIAIVLIEGGIMALGGLITVGILVSFVFYVQEFFDPVVQLSQTYNSYQSAMVGLVRIYGIIDSEKDKDPVDSVKLEDFKDKIEVKDVTFSYGGDNALESVSFSIRKGEKVGIVGHTGAGKTTISNLIMKYYHPTRGVILIDGRNLDEISTGSYRKLIAPVLQDPFMFRGTVLENIQFANPSATREDIEKAIEQFGLHTLFQRMPDGVDSEIGEMGRNLSEGQRQAISLLRAFILDPEILILDEPTSQIDPASEKIIMVALEKFLQGKTLVLITHRFSLIRLVDEVIVLDHGKLVEQGKVDDLMAEDGKFAQLYKYQKADNDLL
ncbi:MAG: ABC transporter ATP-binding protein/permease [Candidatus Thermoplasmatota archaeon]|nr:ABC transporter ATP-binding protein/permease [Candidatus Thermoplasmatota archaeon]